MPDGWPHRQVLPLHEHELRTGRLVVADDGAGDITGFGATLTRSGVTYLADLFVRSDRHGEGIGRALMDALFDGVDGRRFTFASAHPAARTLYGSFGMTPVWTVAYLQAAVDRIDRGRLDPHDLTTSPSDVATLAAIDTLITGRDRRIDFEYMRRVLGGRLLTVGRGQEPVGYAAVKDPMWWVPWHPDGAEIAPVGVLDPANAPAAMAAAVLHAIDAGATLIETFVPEPNPAHEMLLAAGFTREDSDLHMSSASRPPRPGALPAGDRHRVGRGFRLRHLSSPQRRDCAHATARDERGAGRLLAGGGTGLATEAGAARRPDQRARSQGHRGAGSTVRRDHRRRRLRHGYQLVPTRRAGGRRRAGDRLRHQLDDVRRRPRPCRLARRHQCGVRRGGRTHVHVRAVSRRRVLTVRCDVLRRSEGCVRQHPHRSRGRADASGSCAGSRRC